MTKVKVSKEILKIKDIISAPRKVRVRDIQEEFLIQLRELGHRVDSIEKNSRKENTAIDLKRKTQIIHILKNQPLTSEEVGMQLKLSRSRTNQYLKAMEKEGILEGKSEGKKKLYVAIKCEEL